MAVYRRTYRPYAGPTTPAASRFLVIARYAVMDIAESRIVQALFVLCFVPFLIEAGLIYLLHNPAALAVLGVSGTPLIRIDARFFLTCVHVQGLLAFILAAWVGPGLVAPDLANGALPLYLSRPLSRAEYVAGKLAVLVGLLSLVTWVPNLTLFFLKAGLAQDWLGANLRIGAAIVLGSLVWVAVISLMALALSASLRRRVMASLLMCALFFVGFPFGEIWKDVIGNTWGRLANLTYLIRIVWVQLFGLDPEVVMRRGRELAALPTWAAWAALLTVGMASLWLLERRVRAREIVG